MVFGKQDTHVDRQGRSLIRNAMDDAGVPLSVSFPVASDCVQADHPCFSSSRFKRSTPSSVTNRVKADGTQRSQGAYLG